MEDLSHLVMVLISKWASFKSKFDSLRVEGVMHNWEASLSCGVNKVKKVVHWVPSIVGALKFNVDGATKGKRGPAGNGGVLHNSFFGDVLQAYGVYGIQQGGSFGHLRSDADLYVFLFSIKVSGGK